MPSREKHARHTATGDNNRRRILEVAEEVFATYGYDGSTIGLIARRAHLTKPNMLYYYRSKIELYETVLSTILDDWIGQMALFEQAGNSPAEKIAAYIRGKLAFSRERPNASKVFANEIIRGAPHIEKILQSQLVPQLEKDMALVRGWIEDGKIKPIDPYHFFFLIWSSTQSYADFTAQICILLQKDKLDPEDFSTAGHFLVDLVLKGLELPGESETGQSRA